MYHWFRVLPITLLLAFFVGTVSAADPINTLDRSGLWGYKESGVAVRGYDTVAYFTLGKPTEGKEQFETEWKGAKWRFASQEHLDLFQGDPDKYAPQYGGYCAYGVAVGNLVKIEVDLWDIVEGKLYLNYDEELQGKWREDIPGYIVKAGEKFDRLLVEK